jgi:hypothetical protein
MPHCHPKRQKLPALRILKKEKAILMAKFDLTLVG